MEKRRSILTAAIAGAILLIAMVALAYYSLRTRADVREKYVYSDMGTIIEQQKKIPFFRPFESVSGYLLVMVPARTSGHARKGDPDEFLQLMALDTLCSGNSVCLWDSDKKPGFRCSQIQGLLGDRRVLAPVKDYLRSNCI